MPRCVNDRPQTDRPPRWSKSVGAISMSLKRRRRLSAACFIIARRTTLLVLVFALKESELPAAYTLRHALYNAIDKEVSSADFRSYINKAARGSSCPNLLHNFLVYYRFPSFLFILSRGPTWHLSYLSQFITCELVASQSSDFFKKFRVADELQKTSLYVSPICASIFLYSTIHGKTLTLFVY